LSLSVNAPIKPLWLTVMTAECGLHAFVPLAGQIEIGAGSAVIVPGVGLGVGVTGIGVGVAVGDGDGVAVPGENAIVTLVFAPAFTVTLTSVDDASVVPLASVRRPVKTSVPGGACGPAMVHPPAHDATLAVATGEMFFGGAFPFTEASVTVTFAAPLGSGACKTIDTVVTVSFSVALCFFVSSSVTEHAPALTPVALTVNFGPLPDAGLNVAMPLHVLLSLNAPEYFDSLTVAGSVLFAPVPSSSSDAG
jgi:hypothetical protein